MKYRSFLLSAAAFLLPSISSQAAVTMVNFGAGHTHIDGYNAVNGYNVVNTFSSISTTPLALKSKEGYATGIALSYSGPVGARTPAVAGINNPITFSEAAGDAWEALTGGESIDDVTTNGLGIRFDQGTNNKPIFTISGLVAGQEYSMMMLMGSTSTGNGSMWLQFAGVAGDPGNPAIPLASYTGYSDAAGKSATYTDSTDTLRFNSLYGNAGKGGLELTFTASGTDLVISMDGLAYQSGIQAIAFIPEPSATLLGGLGMLVFLRRRK